MNPNETFEMVAKTFQGLEDVLAEELRGLGAADITIGRRMVAFSGDRELLYRANFCCRTALRILKPFFKFSARDADELYEKAKAYDWSSILSLSKTFSIDTVAYSDEFSHSRFVTYRIKDAIVDWFKDRYGEDKRPGVRLHDADVMINVHISGTDVTLSLDSSGESLHKRGYRVAHTEAPINEVLAAGIIMLSGWNGEVPLVDPMCGSGTFLCEAALIAAGIAPGVFRKRFAFEAWPDFDAELFEKIYNDDSQERDVQVPIIGADISPKAVDIARANLKSAGVARYVELAVRPIAKWTAEEVPTTPGFVVTNPPYGERISADDMDALYTSIGRTLKHEFCGWQAWIIGYRDEHFRNIGLAASRKIALYNGALDCELRQYVIFDGDKKAFLAQGGKLKNGPARSAEPAGRKPGDGSRGHKKPWPAGQRKTGGRKPEQPESRPEAASPENPLAVRRNPGALRSLVGRKPSLPPSDGPVMRQRGWKKKGDA
ncbi:MAG: RNA methyltransferase [Bacteroides sp.]|nr:RNA methyltransferase [Bacteroides sp.]